MIKNKKIICSLLLALTCSNVMAYTQPGNKGKGTVGGAALGAIIGQVIGKDTKGTLIGAGIGALAGMGWGAYRDEQEKALRQQLAGSNVSVTRHGDGINLNLPGGVTFATNSSNIASGFYEPLNTISNVLLQYPESVIDVYGFTDNTGEYNYNMQLSQKRADSVKNYFLRQGVHPSRIRSTGYGANHFIATNSTAQGRSMNRRVEVRILPPSGR